MLYVLGAARSGSTILNVVLGSHSEIEGVGELGFQSRTGHVFGEYCACGEMAKSCPFWSEVRESWSEKGGLASMEEYLSSQRRFEWDSRWRPWRLLSRRYRDAHNFDAYAAQTRGLFESIQSVGGKPVIVDTTKLASRALVLSLIPGIDLRVVHLVRDGRGVAWSEKKGLKADDRGGVQRDQPPRPVSRTAAYWVATNLLATWLRRRLGPDRAILIQYEDVLAHPEVALTRIGALLGCDLGDLSRSVENRDRFLVGHVIAGNRLRMKGEVRLRIDQEWMEAMPTRDRVSFSILAGWLLKGFGYRIRAQGSA